MMPKVSVIIPNYNHAIYLKKRVESVLNQTCQDFEIIILDDCSSDNSRDVIEQFRGNLKVSNIVLNKHNSGSTFKQWKKGIDLAEGKYIWIAESDDWCDVRFLETGIEYLDNDQDISLFFTRSSQIDEKDNIVSDLSWWTKDLTQYDWGCDFVVNGNQFIGDCLSKKNVIVNASAVLFKKASLQEGSFKIIEKLKKAGDWLFWILLLHNRKVAYHGSKALNYFREHTNSTRNYASAESRLTKLLEEHYVMLKLYDLQPSSELHLLIKSSQDRIFLSTSVKTYKTLKKVYEDLLNTSLSFPYFLYKRYSTKILRRTGKLLEG